MQVGYLGGARKLGRGMRMTDWKRKREAKKECVIKQVNTWATGATPTGDFWETVHSTQLRIVPTEGEEVPD